MGDNPAPEDEPRSVLTADHTGQSASAEEQDRLSRIEKASPVSLLQGDGSPFIPLNFCSVASHCFSLLSLLCICSPSSPLPVSIHFSSSTFTTSHPNPPKMHRYERISKPRRQRFGIHNLDSFLASC